MRYIPLTDADRKAMLAAIGVSSTEELFSSIPRDIRRRQPLDLPPAMTEAEIRSYFSALSRRNEATPVNNWHSYLGGGCYEHFIPSVVDAIASRGEFSTAYTPYQPEVSQGTLQAIFEFQSMVANLFSLEVANASMYDGASALSEAVMMALRIKEGKQVYLSKGIHPDYRKVIHSFLSEVDVELVELDLDHEGRTDFSKLETGSAALVMQQPNFYGVVESIKPAALAIHAAGGLMLVSTIEAMAFGILKGPGAQGADIVAGEGQSFGNPESFGGPHVGMFATKKEFVRQMPGRLVGRALDSEGKRGYVLTLSTREQHIRRERATSNICTNHSLCALRASVHMALLGARGIREVAIRNAFMARQLRSALLGVKGMEAPYTGPIFNEFVLRLPVTSEAFLASMEKEKILAGIPLSRWEKGKDRELLVSVTETKNENDLRRYVDAARRLL